MHAVGSHLWFWFWFLCFRKRSRRSRCMDLMLRQMFPFVSFRLQCRTGNIPDPPAICAEYMPVSLSTEHWNSRFSQGIPSCRSHIVTENANRIAMDAHLRPTGDIITSDRRGPIGECANIALIRGRRHPSVSRKGNLRRLRGLGGTSNPTCDVRVERCAAFITRLCLLATSADRQGSFPMSLVLQSVFGNSNVGPSSCAAFRSSSLSGTEIVTWLWKQYERDL